MMLRDTRRKAPTLIVFAREPAAGAAKTRLIPRLGAAGAARLADAFIADAMAKAARIANCRTVIAAAAPGGVRASPYFTAIARRFDAGLVDQGDGDLGRRMARVLSAYADPPGAVLIGTDTPTLPPAFIRESIAGLRQAQVVIAPALDGGYYLIGACGPLPAIFDRIPWGGASVF